MLTKVKMWAKVGGREQTMRLPLREFQEVRLLCEKETQMEISTRIAERKRAEEEARRTPPERGR